MIFFLAVFRFSILAIVVIMTDSSVCVIVMLPVVMDMVGAHGRKRVWNSPSTTTTSSKHVNEMGGRGQSNPDSTRPLICPYNGMYNLDGLMGKAS